MENLLGELGVIWVGRLELLHQVVASRNLHVGRRCPLNCQVLSLLQLILIDSLMEVHLALRESKSSLRRECHLLRETLLLQPLHRISGRAKEVALTRVLAITFHMADLILILHSFLLPFLVLLTT